MIKRRGSLILVCIGILLIASAFFLTMYNVYDNNRAADAVDRIVERIDVLRSSLADGYDPDPDESDLPAYVRDPNMPMPAVEIDGVRYIGTLAIPTLDISLPVTEDWNYDLMRISPCRYYGSVYRGDMIIAGHNYTSHLGRLGNVEIGDYVYFIDMESNVFTYTVTELITIGGYAVEEMVSGDDWDLTVFTCNLSGAARVTIRCELSDVSSGTDPDAEQTVTDVTPSEADVGE